MRSLARMRRVIHMRMRSRGHTHYSGVWLLALFLRNVPMILRVRDAQAVYRQQCPADPGMEKSDRNVLQVEIGFERSPGRPAEAE